MKRSLKLTLGLLAIGSISAIAVGSVVSCSNNSNSNSTSSNTLPATITGSSFTDISNNWNTSFLSYSKTSNYAKWMQNNLEQYATNAPTYFSNLAKAYWTVTGLKPTTDSSISTSYLPLSCNFNYNVQTPAVHIPSLDLASQPTTDSPKQSSDIHSPMPTPEKISKSSETETTKYDGYISLQNVTLSGFKENNNLFDFSLTWQYSAYVNLNLPSSKITLIATNETSSEPTQTFQKLSFAVTQTIVGGSFASTILGSSINNLLSTNSDVKVNSGWYLKSCTSNTFTIPSITEILSNSTSPVLTNLDTNSTQNTNNSPTFNGSIKFSSPSSSTILNAPIVTTVIKSGTEPLLKWFISDMTSKYSKTSEKSNVTESGITNNYWLNNFITNGISGYAYVNSSNDIITATNSIKNIDSSMLSDLKESTLDFIVTFDITYNVPETDSGTSSILAH